MQQLRRPLEARSASSRVVQRPVLRPASRTGNSRPSGGQTTRYFLVKRNRRPSLPLQVLSSNVVKWLPSPRPRYGQGTGAVRATDRLTGSTYPIVLLDPIQQGCRAKAQNQIPHRAADVADDRGIEPRAALAALTRGVHSYRGPITHEL